MLYKHALWILCGDNLPVTMLQTVTQHTNILIEFSYKRSLILGKHVSFLHCYINWHVCCNAPFKLEQSVLTVWFILSQLYTIGEISISSQHFQCLADLPPVVRP